MIRKIFGFKDNKSLVNITLENIQNKMYEMGFNKGFVEEIMIILERDLTSMEITFSRMV